MHDPTDPVGRLLFNVLAMIAEFESDLIKMRTREGMKVARAKGRLRGKQPKLSPRQEAHLVALHAAGEHTVSELEELFSVTRSTVYRALARARIRAGHTAATTTAAGGRAGALMARTWLSIRVDLVEGGGHASLWPRPGRIFAAARSHTFAQLATAIDDAFARWDRAHLHEFEIGDALLTGPIVWDEAPEHAQPSDHVRLSRLGLSEQFLYTFDLGDDWTHLCETDLGSDPELTDLPPLRPHWGPRTR